MNPAELVLASLPKTAPGVVATGSVIDVGPLMVRFDGDAQDVPVSLQNEDVSLSTGDRVVLVKAGRKWIVAFTFGASA